jgi:peroxiredoxin
VEVTVMKMLILAVALAATAAQATPIPGQPAPAFAVRDADGNSVSLAALHGKTVVLEWTNEGCPFVHHMYASGVMQALQKDAAAKGIVWLTVVSSAPGKQGYLSAADVGPWKARFGAAPAHVLLDPDGGLGHAYDARTTPDMFVIDPAGKLVYAGAIDDNPSTNPADARTAKNYVTLALADLKAGKAVSPAVTKSYGCSVKYAG